MPLKECIIHRQYSTNECLFVRELFPTLYNVLCSNALGRHIESVFALSLSGKCGSFSVSNGTTNSTHSLFRSMAGCAVLRVDTPYLFRCGVLRRLLLLSGLSTTFHVDKRNQLHA